ncbi:MAG: hypothetical protein AAB459_00450, partial [Patescibacteria group bacterium]
MGWIKKNTRRIRSALMAVALFTAQLMPIAVTDKAFATSGNNDDDEHKVRICHRTSSYTNPYEEIEVDESAVDGIGNGDHYLEHQGPIFYPTIPKHTEWGDIIPPVEDVHSGYNWAAAGQAIWDNDCEFPTGGVKVNKKVDADGNGTFEGNNSEANQIGFKWGLDGNTPDNEMGDDQEDVTAGEHFVNENQIPGYVFTGWFVTGQQGKSCTTPNGTSLPVSVTVVKNQTKSITLCNKKSTGTITIKKDAIPHTNTDFKFTTTATPNTFYLDDEPGAGQDQTPEAKTFENLSPGNYSFTEDQVDGWWLKKIECKNTQNQIVNFPIQGTTVTVNLLANQHITCTFKNHKKGVIKVTKQTYPNGHQQGFGITASGSGEITGNPQRTIYDDQTVTYEVTYGTFNITENVPYGWEQLSNDCKNLEISEGYLERSCTIVNKQLPGSITVIKNVDTNGDGKIDIEDSTYWNWDINGQGDYKTGSENTQKVQAGVYTVSEQQKPNYHVTQSNCTGEEPMYVALEAIQVQVRALENVVCTFTNTRDTGKVKIVKHLVPKEDNGLFNLHINGQTDFTQWEVGNYGSTGFVQVVTGQYNVSETAYEGTYLKDYKSKFECKNARGYVITEGYGTESDNFYVGDDAYITCHFYNKRRPRLTVEKVAVPHDAQNFHFNVSKVNDEHDYNEEEEIPAINENNISFSNWQNNDGYSFYLDDGYDDDKYSDTWSKTLHRPSYIEITEDQVEGWDIHDISCYDGDYLLKTDWAENGVRIRLDYGDNIRCVFTNHKRGKIVVTKYNDLNKDKCFSETLYNDYEEDAEEWVEDY